MRLRAAGIVVRFHGQNVPAVDGVTVDVDTGKTLAIVGPSGAGKTTLLRALAGLVPVTSGTVAVGDRDVSELPPQKRRIALAFSDDALVPTMSVRANLALVRRPGSGAGTDDIERAARAVHVAQHLDRRPRDLSSGERQRAALARALLSEPDVLLLDEPLAHVDPSLRRQLRDELLGLRERFAGPILYVTHDHVEAMNVADELAVLIDGRVADRGSAQRVFDSPRTAAVARFLGEPAMNVFCLESGTLGVRPEHVRVTAEQDAPLIGEISRCERSGADALIFVTTQAGEIVARVACEQAMPQGTRVGLTYDAAHVRHFDSGSGEALA